MAGGLVFTGMPRRREVLGTGIIRWTKVVNPDGTVTWQEAQPTASVVNSKKEEKGTKVEKPSLERPSWIESKKESNVRVTNKRLAHEVEDLEQKEGKVEARPTRAFSFRTEEKKTEERAEEKTIGVEEVRFNASVRVDDKKKNFVAGLASKLDRTAEQSVCPKKEGTKKKEKVETQPAHPEFNPPKEEQKNANAEPLRSHWSKQEDMDNKQESDAELAQRLANTEKIFRQQEQKIQAALDRIRDLEKQLASGFANSTSSTESDEVQSQSKTWDNESIAAGGRESGPHFRHTSISAKGPLPCLSDHNYRVLTVNSNKPQLHVCAAAVVNLQDHHHHHHHHEGSSTGVINSLSRTPSPIAVTINIPPPARQPNPEPHNTKPHVHHPPIVRHTLTPQQHISITQRLINRTVNIPCPTSSAAKPNTVTPAKHKRPLPCLPTDTDTDARPTPSNPNNPSLCLRPLRPVPPRSAVSSFKKHHQKIERPLTPIPEEPSCSLKRRPRVPRMLRRSSRSSSVRRVSSVSVSVSGECSGVRPGSARSGKSHCSGIGAEGQGGDRGGGWKGEGGLRRGSIERVRTN